MTPYIADFSNNTLRIGGIGNYSPEKTFDCGQCFRFEPDGDGGITGIAHARRLVIARHGDFLDITGITADEFERTFRRYLALEYDYDEIDRKVVERVPDAAARRVMADAVRVSAGIRILRQDEWETFCSFIISQNNNIPRIKKIVDALCRLCGERIGDDDYAFPDARAVYDAGFDKIFALRTGFRARYIIDAARRVATDGTFFPSVAACERYEDADAILRQICGVGPKVSACTLLFGFGRTDAFPVDVWIRRVMQKYFPAPEVLEPTFWGDAAGIAQQYLFYYERYMGGER